MSPGAGAAVASWLLAALYYFYQYFIRSAPGVMVPQLSAGYGLDAVGVASLIGLFYYGYAPFNLIAGTALDRFGIRAVVPAGALAAAAGALLFGTGNTAAANVGRFLQGAGGAFALVGAVYIISKSFPASRTATLVGATQMFGSSGASAGQFLVAPMIAGGILWSTFWIGAGIAGVIIAALLVLLLPKQQLKQPSSEERSGGALNALVLVFCNPQSILCGLIAGLLFIPTTIFDMIWGVRFMQEAHGFDYASAVIRSTTIPLGWIVGCPLLGFVADKIGRRKPVIVGACCVLIMCLAWILYGRADILPPYVIGTLAGVASGAAMIPYTVIKEANPPHLAGTATGVVGFLNFTFSALLGPVFGWIMASVSGGESRDLEHYQSTFQPLLYGVAIAALLTFFLLKETGPAALAPAVKAKAV